MIATPQFSHLPLDTAIYAGFGYVLGRFNQVNENLTAAVLAIGTIANHILFQIADRVIRPTLNCSSEAIYTGTNTLTTIASIIAAQQLELISRRWAGIFIFGSLTVLAARIRILAG